VIVLKSVGKSFRSPSGESVRVLSDIDMGIAEGEMVAVLGPSGSGKSTLLNIIGGLLGTDEGEVLYGAQSLNTLTKKRADLFRNQNIGFIFQGSALLGSLNAVDNVLLPGMFAPKKLRIKNSLRVKAGQLLIQLGLEDKLQYFPHQLSLGQKRRVAIARALLNDPAIILADEPTSDLDPPRVNQVISILQGLSSQGRTMLIATHDLQVAKAADRCLEIRDGKLKEI